jgi:Leucine-rich repeat (LRR) protein
VGRIEEHEASQPEKTQLVEAVRTIGGTVRVDDSRPEQPVTGVRIHCAMPPGMLDLLAQQRELRDLDIERWKMEPSDISKLRMLTALVRLRLANCNLKDADLGFLTGLVNLEFLNLEGNTISDGGLAQLKLPANLEDLDLTATGVEGTGLRQLKDSTRFRSLFLKCNRLTEDGYRVIGQLSSLRELGLGGPIMRPRWVAHLSSLRNLETLSLSWTSEQEGILTALGEHPRLSSLRLFALGGKVSDEELICLAKYPCLKALRLPGGDLTDKGLGYLRRAEGLRSLTIYWSRHISDAGVREIQALPHLEDLDLHGCNITQRSIEYLARMPHLQRLAVSGTPLAKTAIHQLRRALPHVAIVDYLPP